MSVTHIDRFAAFAADSRFGDLPAAVAVGTKRVLLDAIGRALVSRELATCVTRRR